MDALIVVDMQVGLLNGEPKHDLCGVIERINRLAAKVRERSGQVIFVQHCSGAEDDFVPGTPGWALLPELNLAPADIVILCVDATVRSAVSNHHDVVVVTDGHTLNDRPHLDAASVIRHHNWVWSHLITQRSVRLARTDELLL